MTVLAGDADRLTGYVRVAADVCDLRDWALDVAVGGVGDDELATCEATFGQRRAKITFTDSWATLTADELRALVAHELVHCHLGPLDHLIAGLTAAGLDEAAAKVADAAYNVAVEYVTDALALVVARALPLPEVSG